jgi:hypothetical protein
MTHLLVLLFYLFHYGRTQILGTIPLLVRSPYLNCWSYGSEDKVPASGLIVASCDSSNWSPSLIEDVCYFLTWNNTKLTVL